MCEPFRMPLEMVERLVTPTGTAFMVRAVLNHARFKPMATVFVRDGRYVAEVEFIDPIGPERQTALVVMLSVIPASAEAAA